MALREFAALPEGRYILQDIRGWYLTECHTVGDQWWTPDKHHAAKYSWYQKGGSLLNEFNLHKDAVRFVRLSDR